MTVSQPMNQSIDQKADRPIIYQHNVYWYKIFATFIAMQTQSGGKNKACFPRYRN